jgi:hypothetical protein
MALKDYKKIGEDHYRSRTKRIIQFGERAGGFPIFKEGQVDLYIEKHSMYHVKMAFDGGYGAMKTVVVPTKKEAHDVLMKMVRFSTPDPVVVLGSANKYRIL